MQRGSPRRAVSFLLLAGLAAAVTVASASVLELNLNQSLSGPGDPFVLTFRASASGDPQTPLGLPTRGDIYLPIELPDRSLVYYTEEGQFAPTPLPLVRDFEVTPRLGRQVDILSGLLPPSLPRGTYTFRAIQVRTATNPLDPNSRVTSSLPIDLNFVTPSRLGNTAISIFSQADDVAVDPGTGTAAVTRMPGIVSQVSLLTNRLVQSIPVVEPERPEDRPWGGGSGHVALHPGRNLAVVTNAAIVVGAAPYRPFVRIIDLATGRSRAHLELGVTVSPDPSFGPAGILLPADPIAINPRTDVAVVSTLSSQSPLRTTFSIVDLATPRLASTFTLDGLFHSIGINPETNQLVAGGKVPFLPGQAPPTFTGIGRTQVGEPTLDAVVIVDLASRAVTRQFLLFAAFPFGTSFTLSSRGVILSPRGEAILAGNGGFGASQVAAVATLDLATGRASELIPLRGALTATNVAFNPRSNQAVVVGAGPGVFRTFLVDLTTRRVTGSFDNTFDPLKVALNPADNGIIVTGASDSLFVLHPEALPVPPSFGSITLRVVNAATGTPVAGATVVVEATGIAALTAPDGTLPLPSVPPGQRVLTVSALGFAPAEELATVQVDQVTTATVALRPEGAFAPVQGRVVEIVRASPTAPGGFPGRAALAAAGVAKAQGPPGFGQGIQPIQGASISIPGTDIRVTAGPDGTFVIQGAPVGRFVLVAAAGGFRDSREIFRIERDLQNRVLLTLVRTLGG